MSDTKQRAIEFLTTVAKAAEYGVIPDYHGFLIPGETTFGIVVDNRESLLSIGANLAMMATFHYENPNYGNDMLDLLEQAYVDHIPELDNNKEYRVIYFPQLITEV